MRQYSDLAIDLAIDKMAEIFNKKSTPLKTSSVLLQAIEIIRQLRREAASPPNPPLTLEELREMDGAPVYFYFGPEHGEWALVLDRPGGVFLRLKNGIDTPARFVHECGGQIYRRKPEEGTT